jgi:CRP/FNR family transcriptional activator FtrB
MILHQSDADRVRSIRLFRRMSQTHFNKLLKSASLRDVAARTILFREGERPTALCTLIKGSAELFSEHHDRRSTIGIVRAMSPCVLTSIVGDRNPMSAQALEPSRLLLVPAALVHELIETDIGFASAATLELAGDCDELVENLKSQRMRTAIERLAGWMLYADQSAGATGSFAIPCRKRTLASFLGMTPENLSRSLAMLAPAGLVVRGRRITINNRPALAAKAGAFSDELYGCPDTRSDKHQASGRLHQSSRRQARSL